MTAELRRGLALGILGLLAGVVLVTAFWGEGRPSLATLFAQQGTVAPGVPPGASGGTAGQPASRDAPESDPKGPAAAGAADPVAPAPSVRAEAPLMTDAPKTEASKSDAPKVDAPRAEAAAGDSAKPDAAKTPAAKPVPAPSNGRPPPVPPAFDVIRVEPTGETVVAGRAAPGATIEMLRGGEPYARALADPSGLFAIVPPALPKGTSEVSLRSIGPDGVRNTSKDTAVIVVPAQGTSKPLIALTSPDKPTVVLSQPEPAVAAREGVAPATPPAPTGTGQQTPVKVVSVDAESGGRLFVTAQAPSGATVRLYLNDTLVAPASAGKDGRVSFAIGRGVQAGQYRVRIDQVDPVSGEVRNRSEVPFNFPLALAAPAPASGPTVLARSPEAEARVHDRIEGAARARPGPQASAPGREAPPAATAPLATAAPGEPAPAAGTPTAVAPPAVSAQISPAPAAPPAGSPGSASVYVPEVATATVTRGDNLWSISRRTYGRGGRYTVIYDANQGQIRDPDLIFPGQIFVLPTKGDHQAETR